MARYIDADRLIADGWTLERHGISNKLLQVMSIADVPTAYVEEVVRCRDCKHYKPYTKPVEDFDGECIVLECETDENEFCSYGTQKESGGEK